LACLANSEDVDIPVARGTKRFRHALTLALLAAGAGNAWATRLDKTVCADLSTELTALLGSGLKEDMDKGPAWAAANLSPERLVSINRVVELQGQIEFRCGASGRNVAKSPNARPNDKAPGSKPANASAATAKSNGEVGDDAAPATKPAQKAKTMRRKRGSAATSPEMPAVVPVAATPAAQPASAAPVTAPAAAMPAKPAPGVQKTAVTTSPAAMLPAASPGAAPAKPAPELGKTATVAPTVTPVSTTPQAAAEAKKTTPVAPITAPKPVPGQAAATVPGTQKTAATKKPSRRDSSSAYVSPDAVNPFSLITGN
jgi:hypothetical protein